MKIKLDENLGVRGARALRDAGHDVKTVVDEALQAAPDTIVAEACRKEGRCLVTLDLDFANPFSFSPDDYDGLAVLRLRRNPSRADLERAILTLRDALATERIEGRLWIVEAGRIRVHGHPPDEPDLPPA